MGLNDILRLSHCPSLPLDSNDSNLHGCFSGNIYDPSLTSVSCADEFGERALLILDWMPPKDCHIVVSLV
eukprot:11044907-Ditylum_brightwellii.AAC.1